MDGNDALLGYYAAAQVSEYKYMWARARAGKYARNQRMKDAASVLSLALRISVKAYVGAA